MGSWSCDSAVLPETKNSESFCGEGTSASIIDMVSILGSVRTLFIFIFVMLKISSYNCKSAKRNFGGIHSLCESSDIVFLQEHWLFPSDLATLCNIHGDFTSFGISSIDPSAGLIRGRPYGGVAVLWRNSLASHVKPVCYEDDRIVGLEYSFSGVKILFVGVYLPYNTNLNFDSYVFYL